MMNSIFKIFFGAKRTRPYTVIFCLVLAGLAEMVSLTAILPAATQIGGGATENSSALNATVESIMNAIGIAPTLTNLIIVFVTAFIVKALLAFTAMAYVAYTVAFVATDMRSTLLRQLLDARWEFFISQRIGYIANSISNDATRAGSAYHASAISIAYFLQASVYAIVAVLVSPMLAVAGVGVGVILAISLRFFIRMSRKHGYRQTDRTAELVTYVSDALANIKPLKSMERQASFFELFRQKIRAIRRALFRQALAIHGRKHGEEILVAISIGIGIYFAAVVGSMPLPELIVMGIVFFQIVSLVGKAQLKLQNAVQYESAWWRLNELIEASEAAAEANPGTIAPHLEDGAQFDNVTFAHDDKPIINSASITIPAGKITVLQGPSGAGKTTLIDLLIGLYRPDFGSVTVDGDDLKEIDLRKWRKMIGYVPQELTLFQGTVRDNITVGDNSLTEEDVERACKLSGVDEFLPDLENGLDTFTGEMGLKLSGGQRQRIALARALVSRPKLLILDEVTSALDPQMEAAIVEKIKSLAGDYTIVSITHRPAWTAVADVLYQVKKGSVSEITTAPEKQRKKATA
ncbi:MAG: ABC transporter ATP-binding protein [Hyphomicrobiales bacterium]